jgi:hypothetical protein
MEIPGQVFAGFLRWYVNITITVKDIIRRAVFYLKTYIFQEWISLNLEVEIIQLGTIKTARLCLSRFHLKTTYNRVSETSMF